MKDNAVFRRANACFRSFIARYNQPTGPFSLEEVRGALADRRMTPSDLAWREGLAGWTPLGDIPGVPAVQPPPVVPDDLAQAGLIFPFAVASC